MIKGATLELDGERVTLSSSLRHWGAGRTGYRTEADPKLPQTLLITPRDREEARARLKKDDGS